MPAAHTSTGIKQEKLSPIGSLLSSGSTMPSGSLPHCQLSNFHSEVKLEPGIGKLAIPNPHQRDLHPDVPCKIKQEPSIEFYDPQTGRKRKQPSPGKYSVIFGQMIAIIICIVLLLSSSSLSSPCSSKVNQGYGWMAASQQH